MLYAENQALVAEAARSGMQVSELLANRRRNLDKLFRKPVAVAKTETVYRQPFGPFLTTAQRRLLFMRRRLKTRAKFDRSWREGVIWYMAENMVDAGNLRPWFDTHARRILDHVARVMTADQDITVSELWGSRRARHIVRLRAAVYSRCARLGLGYAQMARLTGRDHTTIMHHVRTYEERANA